MNVRLCSSQWKEFIKKNINFAIPYNKKKLFHSQTHNESVETAYYTIENRPTYTTDLDIFEHLPYLEPNLIEIQLCTNEVEPIWTLRFISDIILATYIWGEDH